MATTRFIKGYKVNIHVGFNCATIEIYVKRRVGQLTKLTYKNQEMYCDVNKDYDKYFITIDTTKYVSPYEVLRDVMNNVKVEKYINFDHPRYIQELYIALS